MKIFLLAILLLSSQARAEKIWIQAPSGKIPVGDTSYSIYMAKKLTATPDHDDLVMWGEAQLQAKAPNPSFWNQLGDLLSRTTSENDRSFLRDFAIKLMERSMESKEQLNKLYCQYAILDGAAQIGDERLSDCDSVSVSSDRLLDRYPAIKRLMIENKEVPLTEQKNFSISKTGVYNWALLSDSHHPVFFRGSWADLLQNDFHFISLIHGNCDSFTHSIEDLELLSRAEVYFSDDCHRNLQQPETSGVRRWYEKNKSWVLPVGALALGALAYGLRNKKLVITKPSF